MTVNKSFMTLAPVHLNTPLSPFYTFGKKSLELYSQDSITTIFCKWAQNFRVLQYTSVERLRCGRRSSLLGPIIWNEHKKLECYLTQV
jgi:hypothetical protein